jgi:anaerobic ribonucleoside-triphosphate reductase activating protein
MMLRLGHSLESLRPSLTNGPGWRVSLWVQGCSLRCTTQCLNPHLLENSGGYAVSTGELSEQILSIRAQRHELEGISVLGGEPSDQAEGVAALFEQMQACGLSTMLYTGYTLEAIRSPRNPMLERMLLFTDILVDGPFLPNQYSGTLAWRGSLNQRLLCLSDRYDGQDLASAYQRQGKAFSLRISPTGSISISGIQNRDGAVRLEQMLMAPDTNS